jgi:hypothetical protein
MPSSLVLPPVEWFHHGDFDDRYRPEQDHLSHDWPECTWGDFASQEPFRNLFRRPVQDQFTGDHRTQLPVEGKQARPGPQSRLPSLMVGFTGSVQGTAAVAYHLRLTVDGARSSPLAISRIDEPEAIPRDMPSRSASVSVRSERRRTAGTIPPRCDKRN